MEVAHIFNISQNFTLHECKIREVEIQNQSLIISLRDKACLGQDVYFNSVSVSIGDLSSDAEYEHINIVAIKKGRVKEISLKELCSLIQTNIFYVYLDFYSHFAKSLLIKGTVASMEIELIISEIEQFDFLYNQKHIFSYKI